VRDPAGYAKIEKDFVGCKPRTRALITDKDRAAFMRHVNDLRLILDGASDSVAADGPQTRRVVGAAERIR
jgi:hypothetical protein